jgi:hypothetical protein
MKLKILMLMGVCAAVAGCSKPQPQPKFEYLDMKEFMGHVVDPGSWAYWHASGTVTTPEGEKSLAPTTEEGWDAAESGAAEVMQAGNLLQLPGYSRGPEFDAFARDLIVKAKTAKDAAEAKDSKAMFAAGAAMYLVCVDCHAKYVIPAYVKIRDSSPKGPPLPDWPADVKAKQQSFESKAK